MFRNSISFMNVGTAAAGFLMPNISGDSYNNIDDSFVITLRALLFERMSGDETLSLEIKKLPALYESHVKQMEFGRPNCFTIYHTEVHPIPAYKFIDSIRSILPEEHNGYVRCDKVTLFVKSATNDTIGVVAYISEQMKSVVVFINRLCSPEYHLLQAAIPAMMPWYFGVESGTILLKGEEVEVIRALTMKTADDYKKAIVDIFDKIAETLGDRIVCPVCGERGLRPAQGGNNFCEKCFTLFRSEANGQLVEVKSES